MEGRILIENLVQIIVCILKTEVQIAFLRVVDSDLVYRIRYPVVAKTCIIILDEIIERFFCGIKITVVFCDTVRSCKRKCRLAVIVHDSVTFLALKIWEG